MVSHQQAQLRDNWTQTTRLFPQSFIICYILTANLAMAKLSTGCTSANIAIVQCIMLGSSAPIRNVRQANNAHYRLRDSVSY